MILKIGSNNEDVEKLQKYLGLNPDGDFGSKTEKAVKDWQTKNGVIADGIVNESVWNKMGFVESSDVYSKLKNAIPDRIFNIIKEPFNKYEVNSALRISHFLGQLTHESGDFSIKTESLYYTTPQRIVDVWPSRFNLDGSNGKKNANNYIKNEEKLASAVYEGRMGNIKANDGFIFRGAGFLQLTGKDAFVGYSKYINKDIEETANLIRTNDSYALDCALWEYCINMKLNKIADTGMSDDIIKKITRVINGGYIGLEDRIKKVNKFYALLK